MQNGLVAQGLLFVQGNFVAFIDPIKSDWVLFIVSFLVNFILVFILCD